MESTLITPGKADPAARHAARLDALRAEVARRGLDGFVVPRADAHLGEYVPADAERLAWLTGFTGSAGMAIVLAETAVIFVDGRYTLQARAQVDGALYDYRDLIDEPPARWIEQNLPAGARLGYDPWLHGERQVERLRGAATTAGAALVPVPDNPIDAIWTDRPAPSRAPIHPHPLEYAGREAAEKQGEIREAVRAKGADAAVLTLPESIAWLLNVRGGDVPHTPLPLSFAILRADAGPDGAVVDWFVDPVKVGPGLVAHLGNTVSRHAPGGLGDALAALGAAGRAVLVDPDTAAAWVFERLRAAGASIVAAPDPCLLPKARKNPVELAGARAAHRRDGLALVRFLAWLDREAPARAAAGAPLDEVEAAARLLAFRREDPMFRDLSFETISGAGANGAIVHYRAEAASAGPLAPGGLYLVDSGGQYLDGTTDVTRTVAMGTPSAEMRARFTRVLQGHIALATARFPAGTTGHQLDALARIALWRAGLDYDHGTGHGVGSYLGVHEGPQRISKAPSKVPLEPGMIVSNEPGYYKAGAYGIRIENLVAVVEHPAVGADQRPMLGFETLTLAPMDRRLIETPHLSDAERGWLDAYHARVRDTHGERLDAAARAWLERATQPL